MAQRKEEKMKISENIFNIMAQKGMSQLEFSQKTGIAQSTISDWGTKKTNPAANRIMIICKILEVSPEELLEGME
jgi:DNA-binding Xre family transcriptional regulator